MARSKKSVDPRPVWDTYFMEIAQVTATRANCSRRKVAAVVVSENRIISTGYNGTPRGVKNCFDGGCARCAGTAPSGSSLEECICVHAEQNAICQAAYYGTRLAGATIYVTISPCLTCAKLDHQRGHQRGGLRRRLRLHGAVAAGAADAGVRCRRCRPKT